MPFTEKIEVENGIIGIWKLSENPETLITRFSFSDYEKTEFAKINSVKRKKEYIATRLLTGCLLDKKAEIRYLETGKPVLLNSEKKISISHSSEFAAVFISKHEVGIDIENAERNIAKVATRFLHRNELKRIEESGNKQHATIIHWCAKEAIYKCAGIPGIQFNTQIIINLSKENTKNTFTGVLNETEIFNLRYKFYENNIMVYCVLKENKL